MKSAVLSFLLFPLIGFGQTAYLDSMIKSKLTFDGQSPVPNILIHLENVEGQVDYLKGFGRNDKDLEPVTATSQFRIASITKLFVSTLILQLAEEDKLSLGDNLNEYLKQIGYLDLANIHYYNGQACAEDITIEQLLTHRSGLADIFSDATEAFFEFLERNPQKQHSPESILELYYQFDLNQNAVFRPGAGWHYSDMNYVLAGLIIEQVEQVDLAQAIRKRILEPLMLNDTYFEYYEPQTPNNEHVHQYVGNINFTSINTSFDWAGGGLVSTNQDLITFIKALFGCKLFSQVSLEHMLNVQATDANNNPYGVGIDESNYNGDIYYGHYGFYNTYVGYCPKTKTAISYSIAQAEPTFNVYQFISETLAIFNAK